MKTIAFISQKGGTAKTTLAINLAVAAWQTGLAVLVIDLDPQVSALDWLDGRPDPARGPLVEAVPVPRLARRVAQAEADGVELVLIDTAGRLAEAAIQSGALADLILIPVQPSVIDLRTLRTTMDTLRLLRPRKPTRAVLARVKPFGNRHEQSAEALGEMGNEVCPVMIGERVIYQDAFAQGRGVCEIDAGGKAAEEIGALFRYITLAIGLPSKPERQTAA